MGLGDTAREIINAGCNSVDLSFFVVTKPQVWAPASLAGAGLGGLLLGRITGSSIGGGIGALLGGVGGFAISFQYFGKHALSQTCDSLTHPSSWFSDAKKLL